VLACADTAVRAVLFDAAGTLERVGAAVRREVLMAVEGDRRGARGADVGLDVACAGLDDSDVETLELEAEGLLPTAAEDGPHPAKTNTAAAHGDSRRMNKAVSFPRTRRVPSAETIQSCPFSWSDNTRYRVNGRSPSSP
jgi:hypothetical protein